MIKHSDILHSDKWDTLIVLDACRFDTFKKIYKEIIPNDIIHSSLYKGNSEASQTLYWLGKHWSGVYDMIYISGNPYINSMGINNNKYHAKEHFTEIIDSWDWCYDKKTSRVVPELITKDAIDNAFDHRYCNDDKQTIVHYMQPHSPYLFKNKKFKWYEFIRNCVSLDKLPKFLRSYLMNNYKREDVYANLKCDNDLIVKAYEDNLRSVLPSVVDLVKSYENKRFLVTSDHGEYLGENGRFGHYGEINDFITSVPIITLWSG